MQQDVLEATDPRVLGRRLQEARKARHFTQKEVAESLGLARTTITALENGERRIRPKELIQLARLFGRSVSSLVGPRATGEDFYVQFRAAVAGARTRKDQEELERGVQSFQGLCEDYLYLERLNGAPIRRSYPSQYLISGVSPEVAAEDVASSERNRLGMGDGPILNLREILESDVGVRVFYTELPSRVAGLFAYTEELGGCIAVNSKHPEERRRWSMAHEFGHFLTSRFRSEVSMLATYERVPAGERFADAFARCLLMPAAGLRRRFHEIFRASEGKLTVAEVCRVAHYYFVSVQAMMLRMEELRLLPGGAWERLRDRGFKVREAQEQLGWVPQAHDDGSLPIRYQLLAIRAFEEGKLSEGELANVLRVDRVSARRIVQRLTHSPHLLDEGKVGSLSLNLASIVTGQNS